MAARNVTVAEIEAALQRANVELPAGELESRTRLFTIRLDSRLSRIEQFRQIVIKRVGGFPIRLETVADVLPGVESETSIVRNNGDVAVGIAVQRQSQSNTIRISNLVRAQIEEMRPSLPPGMDISIGSDDALFVEASIREVATALAISLVLVILVILTFLRSVRATLIPAITIPVSLLGCFFLIWTMGFSINVLTLLALILAIGLVVDDAIVLLENIERRLASGENRLTAAVLGSRQVTFAVLATSITLIAVFIPISFLKGAAGRLFTEFGFVMAAAVAISTFVSLSACPALASKILKSGTAQSEEQAREAARVSFAGRWYKPLLERALDMPLLVIALAAAFSLAGYAAFQALPRELSPSEDRSVLFIPLTAPQGSTLTYTDAEARRIEEKINAVREDLGINTVFVYSGSWDRPYRSFIVLRLDPWDQRDLSHREVMRELVPFTRELAGARGFPVSPSGLGLRGNSSPLRAVVGGADFEDVKKWAQILLEKAEQNPGLRNVELDFEENQPQLSLALDREKADDLGIGVETLAATLQAMFASREVSTYIDRGREYPVIVQANDEDRQTPATSPMSSCAPATARPWCRCPR